MARPSRVESRLCVHRPTPRSVFTNSSQAGMLSCSPCPRRSHHRHECQEQGRSWPAGKARKKRPHLAGKFRPFNARFKATRAQNTGPVHLLWSGGEGWGCWRARQRSSSMRGDRHAEPLLRLYSRSSCPSSKLPPLPPLPDSAVRPHYLCSSTAAALVNPAASERWCGQASADLKMRGFSLRPL